MLSGHHGLAGAAGTVDVFSDIPIDRICKLYYLHQILRFSLNR